MVRARLDSPGLWPCLLAAVFASGLASCFEATSDCDRNPLLECGRFIPDVWGASGGQGGTKLSPVPGFGGGAGQSTGGGGSGGGAGYGGSGGDAGYGGAGGPNNGGTGGVAATGGSGGAGG